MSRNAFLDSFKKHCVTEQVTVLERRLIPVGAFHIDRVGCLLISAAKAPAVDHLRVNINRFLPPKRFNEHPRPFYMGIPPGI